MTLTMSMIRSSDAFTAYITQNPIIGKYRLLKFLGEGTFGIVYQCRHIETNKIFAVKFLKVWTVPSYALENLTQRFKLEFETGKIKSNFLVQTYEINSLANIPYFICDYCPGGNLERRIHHGLSAAEVINIASCILQGLFDLHRNGKIHRDLKPENILFDELNRPRLTDFGISGHINVQLTKVNHDDEPSQVFGSYAYMAPEQTTNVLRKNTILPTVDIFSFGVVCYEMFTRNLPFGPWNDTSDIPAYLQNARLGNVTHTSKYNVIIPDPWNEIIQKCLNPQLESRYAHVTEILAQISPHKKPTAKTIATANSKLSVLVGEEPGNVIPIQTNSLITLGRSQYGITNHIPIKEDLSRYISRRHATIEAIQGKLYLRDGQWDKETKSWKFSKNGTYINGKPIHRGDHALLYYDDIITIGNTTLKVIY